VSSPSQSKAAVAVFDLGKVLLHFDYDIAVRRLTPHATVGEKELFELLHRPELLYRYETGGLTSEQFFQEVSRAAGLRLGYEQFIRLFSDIFAPIDEMIALHAKLRAAGVPTFIFSNTNEIAIGHIREKYPFFEGFDGYVLSYEEGAMKPQPAIYEAVERLTRRNSAEVVYIDDRPENIAHGLERGWQAILHERPEVTIPRVLTALGLS
jgi:glucose-1-phosphatase